MLKESHKPQSRFEMDKKCPLCAYATDLLSFLHVHCVNAHPKEFFTCPWCTLPFGSLRALQSHVPNCQKLDKNEPHEGDINAVLVNGEKCLVCEGRFVSNEAALKHYKEQHLHFSYICDVCEMYFQRNSSLDMHYTTCHPKSTHPMFSIAINSNSTLNVSSPKAKSARGSPARVSEKITATSALASSAAKRQKRLTLANATGYEKRKLMKWFNQKRCLECEKNFDSIQQIANHFKMEHSTDTFLCDTCGSGYATSLSLSHHARKVHKGNESRPIRQNKKPGRPFNGADHTRSVLASPQLDRQNMKSGRSLLNEADGGAQESLLTPPTPPTTPALQNFVSIKVFSCFLCSYEANTNEVLKVHLIDQHGCNIKTEGESAGGLMSASLHIVDIKLEKIDSFGGEFRAGNVSGFVDLTLDD